MVQVANYQALGEACPASAFDNLEGTSLGQYCDRSGLGRHVGCCKDPCRLLDNFNSVRTRHWSRQPKRSPRPLCLPALLSWLLVCSRMDRPTMS